MKSKSEIIRRINALSDSLNPFTTEKGYNQIMGEIASLEWVIE